jgi:hypothetical protein
MATYSSGIRPKCMSVSESSWSDVLYCTELNCNCTVLCCAVLCFPQINPIQLLGTYFKLTSLDSSDESGCFVKFVSWSERNESRTATSTWQYEYHHECDICTCLLLFQGVNTVQ